MIATRLFLLGSLATTLLLAHPAGACDCAEVQTRIVPGPEVVAPLNTHIWVFNGPLQGVYSLRSKELKLPLLARIYSVPSDRGEGFAVVRSERVVELTAAHPLAPRTRYELLHEGIADSKVVSTLTTGEVPDETPPRWEGPVDIKINETGYSPAACSIGMPSASVRVRPVQDEGAPTGQLLFSVYVKNPEYPEYRSITLHRFYGEVVTLQGGTLCSPRDFAFPGPFEKSELVLKVVDLAGNASAEHSLAIVGPLSHWDRELLVRAKESELGERQERRSSSLLGLWAGLGLGCLALLVVVVVLREQ